jgi:predicted transcriptional regulator
MVNKLLQLLSIKCSHKKISQPFASSNVTPRSANSDWDRPSAQAAAQHYVVCLECGKKFEYDWNNMRVVSR